MKRDDCGSSSSSSEEDEVSCPTKYPYKGTEAMDPGLFDINPRVASHNVCDNYQAAVCCRIGKAQPPALNRLHEIMQHVVGPQAYNEFVGRSGTDKPLEDTLVLRKVMDMLDLKNKILLQQNALPKAFEKIASSHAASRYQDAMEAAEEEMRGIFDDDQAEEAAVHGVEKFHSGAKATAARPQPKITVLGYVGCYDEREKEPPPPKKQCDPGN